MRGREIEYYLSFELFTIITKGKNCNVNSENYIVVE